MVGGYGGALPTSPPAHAVSSLQLIAARVVFLKKNDLSELSFIGNRHCLYFSSGLFWDKPHQFLSVLEQVEGKQVESFSSGIGDTIYLTEGPVLLTGCSEVQERGWW